MSERNQAGSSAINRQKYENAYRVKISRSARARFFIHESRPREPLCGKDSGSLRGIRKMVSLPLPSQRNMTLTLFFALMYALTLRALDVH